MSGSMLRGISQTESLLEFPSIAPQSPANGSSNDCSVIGDTVADELLDQISSSKLLDGNDAI